MSLVETLDLERSDTATVQVSDAGQIPDTDPGNVLPEVPEFRPDRLINILQSEDDAPWVEAAKQAAFTGIVEEFEGPLKGFVTNMIGAVEAEDVVQDTFVRAYGAIGSFEQRHENGLSQWLYLIARRLALNVARGRKTDMVTKSMVYGSSTEPEALPIANQPSRMGIPGEQLEFREMLSVLDELSPIHRNVMILSAEGRTQEEIARIEGISVGALKGRLTRACRAADRILARMDKVPRLPLTSAARQTAEAENESPALSAVPDPEEDFQPVYEAA